MLERAPALPQHRDSSQRLRIEDVRDWTLVQLTAFAGAETELLRVARPILNADLPTQVGIAVSAEARCLFKTARRQHWIVSRGDADPTERCRANVPADVGTVTSLAHSRARIALEGSSAADVLAMCAPLDFHPNEFRVGRFALTGIQHTPVMIHRVTLQRFEIYAMRTFAHSVSDWLSDAARNQL